jgi:hypothetical protein
MRVRHLSGRHRLTFDATRSAEIDDPIGDLGILVEVVAGADAVVAVGHRERQTT